MEIIKKGRNGVAVLQRRILDNIVLPQVGPSQRYQLLLRIAKAANSYLEFNDVLRALGEALGQIDELRSVAVLVLDGDFYRPYSLHVAGFDRVMGESIGDLLERSN